MKIDQVKKHMANKTNVKFNNTEYSIIGCTLRIKDGSWYYQLELKDLKANSIIIADMEKVSV